ncbi:MAG: response regulator [Nevskiaceae bacterium]|nr:MAG: response regulator [Nevskiaceae bacterium]TBR74308.1 MAG: response regulator [Nevskiaceae bacterium]
MARIMVVDDSPTDTAWLKSVLTKAGHEVIAADTGQTAIELARTQLPACIVMDVVMPGVNGFQATRTLSRDPRTANIPIVVVSSKDQPTDRLWAMRQGAKEYLVKPVKDSELVAKIRAVTGI